MVQRLFFPMIRQYKSGDPVSPDLHCRPLLANQSHLTKRIGSFLINRGREGKIKHPHTIGLLAHR